MSPYPSTPIPRLPPLLTLPTPELDAEGAKRHRTGNNWVYQRRDGKPLPPSPASAVPRDAPVQPVIHVSGAPNDAQQTPQQSPVPRKTLTPRASLRKLNDAPEPQQRRFHLSRSVAGVSKRRAAVFVERAQRRSKRDAAAPAQPTAAPAVQTEERKLKKPSTRARHTHTPTPTEPAAAAAQDGSAGASKLPPALPPTPENMDRIAADMNQWVLSEIGANLQSIEDDKARERKLRPRAPAKRFHERHPEVAADAQGQDQDQDMADDMEDDDDEGDDSDWVIEEYVRVPAASVDISPGDVGVLVLEGAEDDMLFFGPEHDDDDEFEDDEDENGRHTLYTRTYPLHHRCTLLGPDVCTAG